MSCNVIFRESTIVAQYEFKDWTSFIWNSKKMPTGFSDNLKKRAFLIVDEFTKKTFSSSLGPRAWIAHPNDLQYWRVGPRSRAQVGSSESPWRSSRSSPGAFQIQKIEIYLVLLSQSQNGETTKRRKLLKTVNLSTGSSFRSGSGSWTTIFLFQTGVLWSSFRCFDRPSHQKRKFFWVKQCYELRRLSEVII